VKVDDGSVNVEIIGLTEITENIIKKNKKNQQKRSALLARASRRAGGLIK